MHMKSQLFWKPLAHTMHHACVVYTVYLHMPLLHSAFRPHTYQLHSISRSSEAHRLAGLCYITTLHSIYKSPCAKLMCTHTNTHTEKKKLHRKNPTNLLMYTLNMKIMNDTDTQNPYNQLHTVWQRHSLLPSLPFITMTPSLMPCSKTISAQGAVVRCAPCQWWLLHLSSSSSSIQWLSSPSPPVSFRLSLSHPVSLWPSAINYMT